MTAQLREAISAIRAGKQMEARRLLVQTLRSDRKNIQAWFLLSYVAEAREQQIDCLRRVLTLDPKHERARKRLIKLNAVTKAAVAQTLPVSDGEAIHQAMPLDKIDTENLPAENSSADTGVQRIGTSEPQKVAHSDLSEQRPSNQVEPPPPQTPLFHSIIRTQAKSLLPLLPRSVGEEGAISLTLEQKKALNSALHQAGYKCRWSSIGRCSEWTNGDSVYQIYHSRDNRRIVMVTEPALSSLPPSSTSLNLDELIEEWFATLTYTERKVLDYLYLDANRFSVGAVGRIIGVSSEKVNEINQRAFAKLTSEGVYEAAKPLMTLLYDLLQSFGKSVSESRLDAQLRRRLMVQKIEPLGIVHLILALEKDTRRNKSGKASPHIFNLSTDNVQQSGREKIDKVANAQNSQQESLLTSPPERLESISLESTIIRDKGSDESTNQPPVTPSQSSFLVEDETPIKELRLSRRSYNALRRCGITRISQMVALSPEQLWTIQNIGEKSMQEIETALNDYISKQVPFELKLSVPTSIMPTTEQKQESLPQAQVHIEVLNLPRRIYNALFRGGVHTINHLCTLSEYELLQIKQIGENSLVEIESRLKRYFDTHPHFSQDNEPPKSLNILQEKFSSLLEDHTPIEVLDLSHQASLRRGGIVTISQLVSLTQQQLLKFQGIGPTALKNILFQLEAYLVAS